MATRLEIKQRALRPIGLIDLVNSSGGFTTEDEQNEHINDAIRSIESRIHNLYEDYFLTKTTLSIVSGTSEYDFPSDIFADKIRRVLYKDSVNNTQKYEIRYIQDLNDTMVLEDITANKELNLQFTMINSTSSGRKIKFYPTPDFTDSDRVTLWYIRNAILPTQDADELDIPEYDMYIVQYLKVMTLLKDANHPLLQVEIGKLDVIEQTVIDTLQQRRQDATNEIIINTEFYEDMNDLYDSYWV